MRFYYRSDIHNHKDKRNCSLKTDARHLYSYNLVFPVDHKRQGIRARISMMKIQIVFVVKECKASFTVKYFLV